MCRIIQKNIYYQIYTVRIIQTKHIATLLNLQKYVR